jgi:prepilin-type processing-associated H-X9-DG protein
VTDYKLFVCPGSRLDDEPNAAYNPGALYRSSSITVLVASKSSCSYLYASGLNLQTHPETAIMADAPVGGSGYGYGWRLTKVRDNHGMDGLNVLYVDGRAASISTTGVPRNSTGIAQYVSINRSQFPFSPYQGNYFYLGNASPVLKDPKSTHLRFLSPVYW